MSVLAGILVTLALIGWGYYLWELFFGNWDVSRTYHRCDGCLGVIRPGQRVWKRGHEVYHFQHAPNDF